MNGDEIYNFEKSEWDLLFEKEGRFSFQSQHEEEEQTDEIKNVKNVPLKL